MIDPNETNPYGDEDDSIESGIDALDAELDDFLGEW